MKKVCFILVCALSQVVNVVIAGERPRQNTEMLTEWNEALLQVAEAEDGLLTLKGLRATTMAHIAMHDAINSVVGKFEPVVYDAARPTADALIAANAAAYQIAVTEYPAEKNQFDNLKNYWLERVPDTAAKTSGISLGEAAAMAILKARQDDGWATEAEYQWHPMAPGVYAEFRDHSQTPEGFIFGAGWGKARGFALQRADQFRSPPPPAIDSAAYTQAFNEVKRIGRFQSLERTPEETHIALWWKDFAENAQNRLGRKLVLQEGLSLAESARLFALINMSIFDAYVSVFDNKFFYNHWRPYTAIRWAEHDGNPETEAEETWTNTHNHTYAFPSYPSAHGTACAAAMTVFADQFGDEFAFEMETRSVDLAGPFSGKIEMRPPVRKFASFENAAMECALSRLYLGIHFRYDSLEGVELGKQVGRNLLAHYGGDRAG